MVRPSKKCLKASHPLLDCCMRVRLNHRLLAFMALDIETAPFTVHSLRSTCISIKKETDFPNLILMEVTRVVAVVTSEELASAKEVLLSILGEVATFTNKYIIGFVIIIGVLGNIMSIIIFFRCKHRDVAIATYLIPLAYADLITVLYGLYSWIVTGVLEETIGYFFIEPRLSLLTEILCKTVHYIYRSSSCISSYILVLFSFERCMGIWFPLKTRYMITKNLRVKAVIFICVLQLVINSPILIYYTLHYVAGTLTLDCYFDNPNFTFLEEHLLDFILDISVPHALPCCLIILFNVLIILGLRRANKQISAVTGEARSERNTLVSLLVISFIYIVSTVPYVACWTIYIVVRDFFKSTRYQIDVLYIIGLLSTSISMMNYSFNFLVYSCTLKIYKDELKSIYKYFIFCQKQRTS